MAVWSIASLIGMGFANYLSRRSRVQTGKQKKFFLGKKKNG